MLPGHCLKVSLHLLVFCLCPNCQTMRQIVLLLHKTSVASSTSTRRFGATATRHLFAKTKTPAVSPHQSWGSAAYLHACTVLPPLLSGTPWRVAAGLLKPWCGHTLCQPVFTLSLQGPTMQILSTSPILGHLVAALGVKALCPLQLHHKKSSSMHCAHRSPWYTQIWRWKALVVQDLIHTTIVQV